MYFPEEFWEFLETRDHTVPLTGNIAHSAIWDGLLLLKKSEEDEMLCAQEREQNLMQL